MDTFKLLHRSCALTVLLVNLIDVTKSVPPEYCLHKLNTSDCNGPPTPVAYYYKPGSRCEVAIWRGCPTLNKFRDEVICSHICIARIVQWSSEEQDLMLPNVNTLETVESKVEVQEWENELESIVPEDLEVIQDIVDGVGDEIKHEIHKLKFHEEEVTTTTEVKAEESATPEISTEETMVEETTTEATTELTTETTATESSEDEIQRGEPEEVITPT